MTAELLRQQGQEVEVAFDGAQACQAAQSFQPDVVVCDLRLPGESGVDVARRLRQQLSASPPWIVAVTADLTAELQEHLSDSPFDGFIRKPLTWEQFRRCCVERRSGNDE